MQHADWLMDGWERICQLWSVNSRLTARWDPLDEIAALLPVIPREIGDWVGCNVDTERLRQLRQMVLGHEDWRTGECVQDTIARNEALMAA